MKRYEALKTDRTLNITKGHIYELEPNGMLSRLMSNGHTKFLTNGKTIIQSGKVKEVTSPEANKTILPTSAKW